MCTAGFSFARCSFVEFEFWVVLGNVWLCRIVTQKYYEGKISPFSFTFQFRCFECAFLTLWGVYFSWIVVLGPKEFRNKSQIIPLSQFEDNKLLYSLLRINVKRTGPNRPVQPVHPEIGPRSGPETLWTCFSFEPVKNRWKLVESGGFKLGLTGLDRVFDVNAKDQKKR